VLLFRRGYRIQAAFDKHGLCRRRCQESHQFFCKAIRSQGRSPETIRPDAYAASHRAVRERQDQGKLPELTNVRLSKYQNNLIEQDHRNVQSWLGAMLGLESFACAATTIRDIELMHRIRKGRFDLRALAAQGQTTPEIWAAVLAAWTAHIREPFDSSLIHNLHRNPRRISRLDVFRMIMLAEPFLKRKMLPSTDQFDRAGRVLA
jgi:hypothetical protein